MALELRTRACDQLGRLVAVAALEPPAEPIIGAEAVHGVLTGWRSALQDPDQLGSSTPSSRARVTASERDPTSNLR